MVFNILSKSAQSPPRSQVKAALLEAHLQQRATVTEAIRVGERGRVAFQSTTWFAFCYYQVEIPPGTPVCVVGRYNATTLIVEPVQLVNTPPLLPDNAA